MRYRFTVTAYLILTACNVLAQTAQSPVTPPQAADEPLVPPLIFKSPAVAQQGYATDGHLHYIFDTKAITAYDANWNKVWENKSPFAGLPEGVQHVGDGEYYDGKLYAPVESFHSCMQFSSQTLAVYSATDGHLLGYHDLSAAGQEISTVTIQSSSGSIYVTSFCQANTIFRYDLNSFTAKVPLYLTEGISRMQGVSWSEAHQRFVVSSDSPDGKVGYLWTVSPTGRADLLFVAPQAGEMEGVDYTQGQIRYVRDHIWFLPQDFGDRLSK